MRKIIVMFICLTMAAPVMAFDAASITFGIVSSAKTSSPNLRIGVVKGALAKDGNVAIQGMPIPRPVNYYLTKSTTHTFTTGTTAILVQTDQDTKLYIGSDLTNYLMVYSGVPVTFTVR